MSRPSRIKQEPYNDEQHHEALDPIQRRVVRLRNGLETGESLTLAETAEAMNTSPANVRRIEASAIKQIDTIVNAEPSQKEIQLLMKAKELQRRVEELEHAVRTIDKLLPHMKMKRVRRKSKTFN